jgi:CheY-like chemotaxis protein
MVHELRSPLATIALTVDLLAMSGELGAEGAERLRGIGDQVERAEEVLRSLRRFSREEAGAMSLHCLNQLVRDAVRLERDLVESPGVTVALDLEPELPPVAADPSQLRLVVANLLRNAAEAMRDGGHPGTIRICTRDHQGVIRLLVEDDGPGLPAEVLSRIFEPYFTTKETGTGLGLALSAGIVRAHGGHLWAENRRPRGARFVLDLPDPRHATPARQANALGVDLSSTSARVALVVDPRDDRREELRRTVAALGFKVHVAGDARLGLRKLAASAFDLVLAAAGADADWAVDFCARGRLHHPDTAGRFVVLLDQPPGEAMAARLRLVGVQVVYGAGAVDALASLARRLAHVSPARPGDDR